MSRRPWMALYVGDYLADTAHLSIAQSGAYLHLIMHYWMHGRLPSNDEQLARIARMLPEQWAIELPVIQAFFHDGWRHKRIDQELAAVAQVAEDKRRAGISSGASRRNKGAAQNEHNEHLFDIHSKATSKRCDDAARTETNYSHSHSQLEEESKSSEAGASEPNGSPPTPVYTDVRHELWAEGTAILASLGVKETIAKPNIGRWLKDTRDDAETVLGAIQRARDGRIVDPIPWITQAIKPKAANGSRHAEEDRSVHAGIDRLVDQFHAFDADLAGTRGH